MPTPGTHFVGYQLGNYWRDVFDAALRGELGLQRGMNGSLEEYPAGSTNLAALCPAFFLKLMSVTAGTATTVSGLTYRYNYRFRLVYIDRGAEGQNIMLNRVKIQRFGDTILENWRMHNPAPSSASYPDLSASSMSRIQAIVSDIDFRPPEDNFVVSLNAQMLAAALTMDVDIQKGL